MKLNNIMSHRIDSIASNEEINLMIPENSPKKI